MAASPKAQVRIEMGSSACVPLNLIKSDAQAKS